MRKKQGQKALLNMQRAEEHQKSDGRNDIRVHHRELVNLLHAVSQDAVRFGKTDGRKRSDYSRYKCRNYSNHDCINDAVDHRIVRRHLFKPFGRKSAEPR